MPQVDNTSCDAADPRGEYCSGGLISAARVFFLRWPGYDTAVLTQKTGVSVFVGPFCSKSVRFSGKTAMRQSLTHWQCAGKFAASSVISAGLERTDSMLLRSPSCVTFRCFPQSGLHDGKSLRLGKIEDGPRNILSSWICIHEEQRFT